MKREDKVISLELAKRLHELGVRVESEWWWCDQDYSSACYAEGWNLYDKGIADNHLKTCYSAYDTAELGEMLPASITIDDSEWRYEGLRRGKWICGYRFWGDEEYQENTKEAEAKGKMLVWLLENDYVKVGELC